MTLMGAEVEIGPDRSGIATEAIIDLSNSHLRNIEAFERISHTVVHVVVVAFTRILLVVVRSKRLVMLFSFKPPEYAVVYFNISFASGMYLMTVISRFELKKILKLKEPRQRRRLFFLSFQKCAFFSRESEFSL